MTRESADQQAQGITASLIAAARENVLLSQLDAPVLRSLAAELELVDMAVNEDLYAPAADVDCVYFPVSGLCSFVSNSQSGAVDVGPIGFDGMVGLPIYLDAPTGPLRVTVHVAGHALRQNAESFRSHTDSIPTLDRALRRYVQWTYTGMGVWVACARLHDIEQRCARWLLMAHDRVRLDRFPLTHEYLAQMLGVRRPTVSVAARMMQDAGLIRYTRGSVIICDRRGLEKAACDCYALVTDEYERIFGRSLRQPSAANVS